MSIKPILFLYLFLDCRTNPLGIQQSLKYVTDSQMTAYNSYTASAAWSARIGGSSYWYGRGYDSYLQIDFGMLLWREYTFKLKITIKHICNVCGFFFSFY